MTAIRFCIWDVGQVIYPYSLNPLNEYCRRRSVNQERFAASGGVKTFNYDPFMRGEVTYEEFCRDLCDHCGIIYTPETGQDINREMRRGAGRIFAETSEAILYLRQQGIINAILSNALPNLVDAAKGLVTDDGLIAADKAFCSFDFGLLKPDPRIFKAVLDKLQAKPDEVIFVDDKSDNVEGAQSLGIHGIVFERASILPQIKSLLAAADR